ncbi:Zinc finger protein [Dirofilaria immitis]
MVMWYNGFIDEWKREWGVSVLKGRMERRKDLAFTSKESNCSRTENVIVDKEMLGGCCVCADENGWESNPLVYCDGPNCEVAVHQGCYGIVEVPEGEWYCAKCADFIAHSQYNGNSGDVGEVRETPRCKLCPFGHGALKRTNDDEWAHVICALYIPEVRFGDVHSMDPVILSDVPLERFQQQCYLCMERGEEKRAYLGACMPCNKPGCKKCFHVTCAQAEGLLCEEGGGSKNVKYCGYCAAHAKKAISDPLIKIIPPYRHRAESSCSSGSGGGGVGGGAVHGAVTPKLGTGNAYSGDNSGQTSSTSSPHFNTSELLQNASPAISSNYGNVKLATTISSSGTATSFASSLRPEGPTMLVDSLYRTSLPPPAVDRAMLNAVMSQPLAIHSMREDACSPPMSSGRSSTAHSTPPPVTTAVSLKKDLTIYELPSSSNATVPLLTNVTLFGVSAQKSEVLSTGVAEEKDLNNGSLISQLEIKLHSRTNYVPTDNGSVTSAGSKTVKRKAADGAEKPKRPRNNKACKSMKALLESVGPLISETVSDFQRERLNERDSNLTATATTHSATPSTSTEHEITTCTVSASTSAVQCTVVTCSSTSTQQQQPAAPTVTTASTFVGVPLIRTQPKAVVSPDAGVAIVTVDRTHVTSSLPSTSSTVASTSVCSMSQQPLAFPQSMEELLERQWEQGSHFLMSHAPFDIAQLLSCLHELKMENVRLEETLSQLARRRDHLLALNTRLSLSLASGSSLGFGTSPHHSPRISAAGSSGSIPLASTSNNMQSNNGISSTQCTTQPTSSASISSLPSIVPLPPTTVCGQQQSQQQQQQQSLQAAAGSAVISFLNPFCSTLPPIIDDSLNQLRSLASNGSVITNRSGHTPQAAVAAAAAAAAAVAAAGQLAGTAGSTENRQTPVASTNSGATSIQHASLPSSQIPSAASTNTGIGASLLANFNNVQLATSIPSTAAVTSALDLFGGSQSNAHLTLTPERQQMAAAAIAAAAAANALGGNFVAPRTPTHSNTAVSGTSAIGQLASTELLAQYALLAQQQLLHQQAAVAALSARYGSQVISSSSTSPHSTSSNSQLSSNPHSGK